MAVEKVTTPRVCPKGALHLEHESRSPKGRGVWYARIPHDHTIEDVLNPSYFGHAQQDKGLRATDIIDVEPDSAAWRTQVRVMALQPDINQVKVREAVHMRQSYEAEMPKGYSVEWAGEAGKWSLLRGKEKVGGGFDTQDEAAARAIDLTRQNKEAA